MSHPEITILVSSFERPAHLRRVLASIAAQQGIAGAFEVVVTDDGSRDETPRVVREFAASATFPVHFTTHPHSGFHIARCRNEGVAATTAPYLLFLDGDCMIPPDHVRKHLDRRREGYALAGYPIYFNESTSSQITADDARSGSFQRHVTTWQLLQMRLRHLRSAYDSLIRDPLRPKLLGGNLGIARADYERVNGYDEHFHGWGCEDDDLRARLRTAGINVASIAWWTHTYHLWHPRTPSAPATWRAGANVEYFKRPIRLTRSLAGLAKRRPQDLHVQLVGRRPSTDTLARLLPLWCNVALAARRQAGEMPEIEIAIGDADGSFSSHCDCRVLIVPKGQLPSGKLVQTADLIFTDHKEIAADPQRTFALNTFDAILQRQLGFRHSAERRPISSRQRAAA